MNAPETIETMRLILRRPLQGDAEAIFARFASDPDVTRYLGWPRHRSIEDSKAFISMSDSLWAKWPGGPYLIESRESRSVLGSTGFGFETPFRAAVGYVLAKDAWGQGYATEALRAISDVAPKIEIRRLYAFCHTEHKASSRVLEKCDFVLEGTLRSHSEFPNLVSSEPMDVFCYSKVFC